SCLAGGSEQPLVSATYLTLQPPGFTAMYVAIQSRRLLPYVFTLTRVLQHKRFIFCGTFRLPIFIRSLPVRKRGALCCPDFPPAHEGRAIEQVCFAANVNNNLLS